MNRRLTGSGIVTLAGGLRKGDSVVFQMENPQSYSQIVEVLLSDLQDFGGRFHFIGFCQSFKIDSKSNKLVRFHVDPAEGFEHFVDECSRYIMNVEDGDIIMMDCLTELMGFWGSDWLIGYAYQLIMDFAKMRRLTTFTAVQRKCHRQFTSRKITEVSTVTVRVMRDNIGRHCLVPRKAKDRQSAAMYKPYIMETKKGVRPIHDTLEALEIQNPPDRRSDMQYFTCLDNLFLGDENADGEDAVKKLCRVLMGMDERIQELAAKNFTLEEMKIIRKRTIGSGFIGGKAAGMLIARKIIRQKLPHLLQYFAEADDSFFLGSDAFYTYLIYNGLWDEYKSYSDEPDGNKSRRLHRLVLNGKMPAEILERLEDLVDYYGHFPIIVRSSSHQEDSFESSYAGKYESRFCILTGDDSQMLSQLADVVKAVFASTFNREVDSYRKMSRLIGRADIMSVIIQRVSGVYQGDYFLPHVAGVGHSYNSFVWDKKIDPESGLLRMVAGLGTRAVSRSGTDYARMIAVNRPNDNPMPGAENKRLYSQRLIDVVDTVTNRVRELKPSDLHDCQFKPSLNVIAARDMETEKKVYKATGENIYSWMVDLDHVINRTAVVKILSEVLKTLEGEYSSPVEIEFTINFQDDQRFLINLLQCRPVQVQRISDEDNKAGRGEYTVFKAKGTFLGGNNSILIDTVVYVNWEEYVALPPEQKKECAKIIGILNNRIKEKGYNSLLMGYGRWGSSVTSLGVPVAFSDIDGMKAILEIGRIERGLVPEMSYGTHFFHEVVESKITYICVLEDKTNFMMDETIPKAVNMLRKAVEEPEGLEKVIGYFRFSKKPLRLVTDIRTRTVAIYREIQPWYYLQSQPQPPSSPSSSSSQHSS
ncbi:PEP/pyruvate-binding domain-containing protein [Seleniivibrio woodruffii]|uniref:Phosphoenolpyruvate synthase n=1 Tax=Seleniivibrio woodruffii TaxID=1078050 RepID=A0A4R1K7X3_9BACT|nr:PEP/pyruvate-binding domain-containing protein [Seleniivibrio woodruffii]TCK60382.1 pyruvate phosphate dikinase-like enzyme [Seleniivibrio woodruffii]TVZ36009.1 pyruvate phosphate dikinase-like enzyme [Seleniivibrio woodruffii]